MKMNRVHHTAVADTVIKLNLLRSRGLLLTKSSFLNICLFSRLSVALARRWLIELLAAWWQLLLHHFKIFKLLLNE
jgi:hypothetical protein